MMGRRIGRGHRGAGAPAVFCGIYTQPMDLVKVCKHISSSLRNVVARLASVSLYHSSLRLVFMSRCPTILPSGATYHHRLSLVSLSLRTPSSLHTTVIHPNICCVLLATLSVTVSVLLIRD